ncbi:hypothetical protein LJC46_04995 [Desulfovibrio sp. OttesenSCG-928-G15]|nr:hypothetical protein [Desulfovibrio sp. OttesenSCG-928-G15]
MNTPFAYCRVLAVFVCLFMLATPLAAHAKNKHSAAAHNQEVLHSGLITFGKKIIESYNRCVMPNKKNMKVEKHKDGTYTAEYMSADPNSVSGSVKPAVNPGPVKYIGYLRYSEIRHISKGKTKAEAKKGPFTPVSKITTELVKYMNGKWTY